MTTSYERFLATVPSLAGLGRRQLRAVAGLVDDVSLPAGREVRAGRGEALIVVSGLLIRGRAGTTSATPVRLLVFGRRELRTLRELVPDLVVPPLEPTVGAVAGDAWRRPLSIDPDPRRGASRARSATGR